MKFLIFDFDGVLVDSMPTFGRSVTQLFDYFQFPCPENIVQIATPLGYVGTADYLMENFPVPISREELIGLMKAHAYDAYAHKIPAKEAVRETLELLRSQGYSLNVLTASPHMTLDACLKRLEMFGLFDHVWSCEDFGTTKSDTNLYQLVAKALSTTVENCTFLDDNIHSLTTGKTAGMDVIGVYDDSSRHMEEKIRSLSGKYIRSFRELPDLLALG